MATFRVRSRVVYPQISTELDTSAPDTLLFETLRNHYQTFTAPTAFLHSTVRSRLRDLFHFWRSRGEAAGVPLLRWLRNHIAETPSERLDAVRRMLLDALDDIDLTQEEKTQLSKIVSLIPVSPLTAQLLDGPEGVAVPPTSLVSLFARWGEAAPTLAACLKQQQSQRTIKSLHATVLEVFLSTPPDLHNQVALHLLSQWDLTGLPPLTISGLGQLPRPLLNSVLSILRQFFNEEDSMEGATVRAAFPPHEMAVLDALRLPAIGDTEAAVIVDPACRHVVNETARRLARAWNGKPPRRGLLLPWFKLLDRSSVQGIRDFLHVPLSDQINIFRSLSHGKQVALLHSYIMSPQEREAADESPVRVGTLEAEEIDALLCWLEQNGFARVITGMLEGKFLGFQADIRLMSLPLWHSFLRVSGDDAIWQILQLDGPGAERRKNYSESVIWRESVISLLQDVDFQQRLAARLLPCLRQAGPTVNDQWAYLQRMLRNIPEVNGWSRTWRNEYVYFLYLMGALGEEGRTLTAYQITEQLKTDNRPYQLDAVYEELRIIGWSGEEMLALGPPSTRATFEVVLNAFPVEQLSIVAPQLVGTSEAQWVDYTLPDEEDDPDGDEEDEEYEDNDDGPPWMELARQHTLPPALEGKLRILAAGEPRIRRGLFVAAPVRFRDFIDAATAEDLLPRLTQGFDILREYARRTLSEQDRAAAWEMATERYSGSVCGVALELALTFGMDLLPTFYRFTLDAWRPIETTATDAGENETERREPPLRTPSGMVFDARYHTWELPKKSGGRRKITAPERSLKYLQRRMLEGGFNRLLTEEHLGDSAHGFVPGRNIVTNAAPHIGQPLVVNVDIESFFPSIRYALILKAVAQLNDLEGVSLSAAAQRLIADLCSYQGALPTGSPTSPAIANLTLRNLDQSLATLCMAQGITYTRYADDLTFSGDNSARTVLPFVKKCLAELGLELDEKKTNLFRRGRRQIVTGLVVNEKPNLPRRLRRELRAAVHRRSHGVTPTWDDRPMDDNELAGRLAFLQMVQPEEAERHRQRLRGGE